nr:MAG TPA: hypothetical protein [Caudoviricetes sp.]
MNLLWLATCPSHFLGWDSSFFHCYKTWLLIGLSVLFIFLPLLYHPRTYR